MKIDRVSKAYEVYEKHPSSDTAYQLMLACQSLCKEAENEFRKRSDTNSGARRMIANAYDRFFQVSLIQTDDEYILSVPPLLNKSRGMTIHPSLREKINTLASIHDVRPKSGRHVTFNNKVHSASTVQDYDNLDTREILNILAGSFLVDDNIYVYSLTQCTEVISDSEEECCEIHITI